MYPNLKAVLAARNITILQLSQRTGIPYSTLTPKLRGEKPITVREAELIKSVIGTDISLEDLFSTEAKV